MSEFKKLLRFLLCVIDIYSTCAWVVALKDKRCITIANAFQEILDESGRKPDKGNELRLKNSYLEMYSTHNKRKSAIGERFMRNL